MPIGTRQQAADTAETGETAAVLQQFGIDVVVGDRETLVVVTGELDAFTSPRLRDVLHGCDGASRVIVDTSAMSFIDSTGLGVLVGASTRLASLGCELVVRSPRPSTWRVFEIAGILDVVSVER